MFICLPLKKGTKPWILYCFMFWFGSRRIQMWLRNFNLTSFIIPYFLGSQTWACSLDFAYICKKLLINVVHLIFTHSTSHWNIDFDFSSDESRVMRFFVLLSSQWFLHVYLVPDKSLNIQFSVFPENVSSPKLNQMFISS